MRNASQTNSGGKRLQGVAFHSSAEHPLVTVITVVFNGRQFVERCLLSVLGQDYPNIEHIVMDGASTDGTLDVLRQYENQIALWRSEPDRGVYDAWNKGLREAHGEWICFLGVDDELLPGSVSDYMTLAARNPHAEYLCSRVRWVHGSGQTRIIGEPWNWSRFSRFMCTAHVASMHRRSLFDALGDYDISYQIVADYELLLRAKQNLKAAYMPTTTAMMRAGGVSDSAAAIREQARAKLETGGRNALLTALELRIASLKFRLRPLRAALGKIKSL